MMMNAGAGFWHEEKVKEDEVEMLQIFVRPNETDLSPEIQFHDKPVDNRDWYVMAGPEGSEAPLYVRQNVYILDAHPKVGEVLEIPTYARLNSISIRDGWRNCDAKSYHWQTRSYNGRS